MRKIYAGLVIVFLLLLSFHVSANYNHSYKYALPEKTITGTVTESKTGNPLAGVSIQVKGTNTGTVSDTETWIMARVLPIRYVIV